MCFSINLVVSSLRTDASSACSAPQPTLASSPVARHFKQRFLFYYLKIRSREILTMKLLTTVELNSYIEPLPIHMPMNKDSRILIMHRSQYRLFGLTLNSGFVPSHRIHTAFIAHVSVARPAVKTAWKPFIYYFVHGLLSFVYEGHFCDLKVVTILDLLLEITTCCYFKFRPNWNEVQPLDKILISQMWRESLKVLIASVNYWNNKVQCYRYSAVVIKLG